LITGFTPFRNHPVNPSKLLAEVLAKEGFDTLILPVSYASAEAALLNRIALTKYDFILSFGLAASRARISLEEKAFNEKNSPVQDNDGKIVLSQKIRPNGAKELTNPLPLENGRDVSKKKKSQAISALTPEDMSAMKSIIWIYPRGSPASSCICPIWINLRWRPMSLWPKSFWPWQRN
jgi:pyrrolidone-carboxylate peptidase